MDDETRKRRLGILDDMPDDQLTLAISLDLPRNLAHSYRFRNVRVNVVNLGACIQGTLHSPKHPHIPPRDDST